MATVAGRLAFVTGAGSGIGREICKVLATGGVKVIATDRNVSSAEETLSSLRGNGHLALEMEVTNSLNIDKTLKIIRDHFVQPPTIVVNSAGVTRDNFVLSLTEDQFDEVINVNLKGTFLVMQKTAQEMITAGVSSGASIINISSIIGKTGNIGQSNYSAAKAGVVAITKTASMEFGQFGIRVNAILPGFIETPMTETVPDKVKEMFVKRVPLRRMGKPKEIADVVYFLASDSSSYINGTSIEVTGGMT
ncbi:(3R)-3-hydroxyacyl-CoA dehydrogenase [Prorops nasuta]|uniref:(3R)-3-hydroxyacyl-CoA dehydrogenase n=1 Tax=Prorops nasuta TaxID=863751 RepID=UPI0034CD30CA